MSSLSFWLIRSHQLWKRFVSWPAFGHTLYFNYSLMFLCTGYRRLTMRHTIHPTLGLQLFKFPEYQWKPVKVIFYWVVILSYIVVLSWGTYKEWPRVAPSKSMWNMQMDTLMNRSEVLLLLWFYMDDDMEKYTKKKKKRLKYVANLSVIKIALR